MQRRMFLQTTTGAALAQSSRSETPFLTSVMLWTLRGSFQRKLEIAAEAGMDSVELVDEHLNWSDARIAEARKEAAAMKLGLDTIIATPAWTSRPVSMLDPAQSANFLGDVEQALVFARKLEIPQVILIAGNTLKDTPPERQFATLVENTKRAGDLAAKANLTLIVEPLNNKVDHKGFFLASCVDGLRLIREADNPHVKLLFDIYHEQVQSGNVIRTIREAAPHTAVFHIADNPGRNDPGTGEMNYPNIFAAIKATGYRGYITMEYVPKGDAAQSLTKALKLLRESWA